MVGFAVVVGKFHVGAAGDGDRARIAHQPDRQVDHVDAEVDQRTAARLCLCRKPTALARDTAAANPAAAAGIELAGLAVGDVFLHVSRSVDVAVVAHDHQDLARFFLRTLHLQNLFHAHSVGLFAEHVLAGVQRGDGDDRVQIVRRADINGVDVVTGDDVEVVFVNVGVGDVLVADLFRPFDDDVAERDHLDGVGHFDVLRNVAAAADTAVTDQSNPQFFHK